MTKLLLITMIICIAIAFVCCCYALLVMKESEENIFFTSEEIEESRRYDPKKVIRDWGLNFNLSSALKHIEKASKSSDKMDDLLKAKRFIDFEIEEIVARKEITNERRNY